MECGFPFRFRVSTIDEASISEMVCLQGYVHEHVHVNGTAGGESSTKSGAGSMSLTKVSLKPTVKNSRSRGIWVDEVVQRYVTRGAYPVAT